MSVGAKYTFEKSEVYWPEGDDSTDYSKINDLVGDPEPVASGLEPSFQASVQASADLDVMVTPEANIGITIGGSSLIGGVTLVDAQMIGFVNTTLRFHADSGASVLGDSSTVSAAYTYNYGVYLLYNLRYDGHATIPFYECPDTVQKSKVNHSLLEWGCRFNFNKYIDRKKSFLA
ncbi:unnamed protein product [Penicillium discolor]